VRSLLSCSLIALLFSGCAAEHSSSHAANAEAKERCDVMVTGSRIPRCDSGGVHSLSGDDFDRERRDTRSRRDTQD